MLMPPVRVPPCVSLALVAALAAPACTLVLDSDRHQSDVVPVPATQFCAQLAAMGCASVRDCCMRPDLDLASCTQAVAVECANDFGALGIDPRTGYDDVQAGFALAEARELAATCDPALYAWINAPTGFRSALAGTVPYGGSCDPTLMDTTPLLSCADDGVCTLMGTEWFCNPPVPRGEECSFDGACEPGLRCTALVQFIGTGSCQPLKAVGADCTRDSECETYLCDTTCRDATVVEAYCSE